MEIIGWLLCIVVGFLAGWMLCEIAQKLVRRRSIANPHVRRFEPGGPRDGRVVDREHEHTRPPGWHP